MSLKASKGMIKCQKCSNDIHGKTTFSLDGKLVCEQCFSFIDDHKKLMDELQDISRRLSLVEKELNIAPIGDDHA